MFSKIQAIILAAAVMFALSGTQAAKAQTDSQSEKARAKVQQIGVGSDTRVEVKLRDNTKLKGYISAAGADSFSLTDSKMGTTQTVAYTDVAEVRKQGGGLSTRTLIILGAVGATALIVGLTVVKPVLCDGGAGC
jgi:hypothetical protein